ncbi:putative baseplate assembly protein [Caulobacter endophyticus]|uniref:Putative baseplate assembly protein n=1 Tax=Caulobacter endophyticus TaxID=2172652 RepID=A0A2T9JEQ2_9CAUL|nr:putative baseplate assembly protein [Caulobacter endophyticus]PVM82173.1 putative baseplate assembly protein [Caulobacter endophyticus]
MTASPHPAETDARLRTPLAIDNRPGLSAISYRIGGHAAHRDTMLDQLTRRRGLNSQDRADVTTALVDAFASMAEVIGFYQERIANESYLRTATERRSLVELGRLIDYEPRPGVASSAYLAFTLETAPGAPAHAARPLTLPAGLKVQSLPGPGETPQPFETSYAIEARPEWNAILPATTQEQPLSIDAERLVLKGSAVGLQPGSTLLVAADGVAVLRVMKATSDPLAGVTQVDLAEDPPDPPPFRFPLLPIGVFMVERFSLTNHLVASTVLNRRWRQHDLHAMARVQRWPLPALSINLRRQAAHRALPPSQGLFAFRQKAGLFGHNAPKHASMPAEQRASGAVYAKSWDNLTIADQSEAREIDLDRVYEGLAVGGYVILEDQDSRRVYRIEDVAEISRADFSLSAKVTRLRLDSSDGFSDFTLRGATVHLQSEQLTLADLPIVEPVEGDTVTLDGPYFDLSEGQTVVLTGTREDLDGVTASEVLTIADILFVGGSTILEFKQALANRYVRSTVTINANVALATHGETVGEVLGSGDASQAFQTFALRQPPLTYVSSDAPSGAQSTLQVRVSGVLWREAANFHGHGPDEQIYITRATDDGRTLVVFGDGVSGARPATGQENITAVYRKGMGMAGDVGAARLTLLSVKPPGVRGVVNPLAAEGAAGAETLEEIRGNAALTMLTLDRIVSLQDYEDFARAFAGVAKALATWSWIGATRGVFVTVGGGGGAALPPESRTYVNLLAAMRKAGDPNVALRVRTYRNAFFRLSMTVVVETSLEIAPVLAAVEARLRGQFSFEARAFGQPVALSEVLAAVQSVPGVVAAQVGQFFRTDEAEGVADVLLAAAPQSGSAGAPAAAELLTIDPRPISLVGVRA